MKQILLSSYLIDLCVYMNQKLSGKSVEDHSNSTQLLEIRSVIEKLHPIDVRLKYQLEKLFRFAQQPEQSYQDDDAPNLDPLSYKPNPDALMGRDDMSKAGENGGKNGLYKPPKFSATRFEEDDTLEKKEMRREQRRMEMVRRGEIVEALREDFGDAPEVVRETYGSAFNEAKSKALDEEDDERREFEEEHMMRLPTSKKYRSARKARMRENNRLETIVDVGRAGEFIKGIDFGDLGLNKGTITSHKRDLSGALSMAIEGKQRKKKNRK